MELMENVNRSYVASFDSESYYERSRYHWMICLTDNAEELVSWGHEPTRDLAEAAAEKEVQLLACGLTQGGHVVGLSKPIRRRRPLAA
jgi:hypothetical protein